MDIRILIAVTCFLAIDRSLADCKLSNFKEIKKYADIVLNCSKSNLREINALPNIPRNVSVALDLSFNKFQFINASIFTKLQSRRQITSVLLHHNNISYIEEHAFSAFPNLLSLNLASCSLHYKSISRYAFFGLTILQELFINDNIFYTQHLTYPSLQISHLLSLRKIYIDVFEGFEFNEYFKYLRNLSEIVFNPQGLFHLTNKSFHGLSKCPIKYIFLNFAGHAYCEISEDLFCSFPFLKGVKIDISFRCNFTRALRSLKCLQNRTLDYIDAGGIVPYIAELNPPQVGDWAMEYLSNICVNKLLLNHDWIQAFTFSHIGKTLLKCLNYLDLSKNNVPYTMNFITSLFEFQNIRVANLSDTLGYTHIQVNSGSLLQYNFQTIFNLPSTLEVLDFSYNYINKHEIETLKGARMRELYFRKTMSPCLTFKMLDMPFLELLDISECIFKTIQPHFFRKLKMLKTLLAKKSMQNVKLNNLSSAKLFVSQTRLSFLDLSENSLHHLHISIFRFQRKSLKTLILDKNVFYIIPKALTNLHSLSILSLKYNKIAIISQADLSILHSLGNIRVYISGNSVSCSCSTGNDLYRIKANKHIFTDLEEVFCFELKSPLSELLSDKKWRINQLTCISPFWLKFSVAILLISILSLIAVAGIYRNHVLFDYFLIRVNLLIRRQKYDINHEKFNFDVFISYSNIDYIWVISTLYKRLLEYGFKVCVHDKDFIPGNSISEEIVRCIDESRKILFVVTESFLNSSWTSYEIQMAKEHAFRKNHEKMIIILIKDDIAIARMPKELKNIWCKIVCAKWPQQTSEREIDTFWQTLKSSIEQ